MNTRDPLGTIIAVGIKHYGVTADLKAANERVRMLGFLEQANTGMVGHDLREPMSTIVGKGCTQRLITAHTVKLKGSCRHGQSIQEPLHTIAAGGEHHALVQYELAQHEEAGALRVAAFLMAYYGEAGSTTICVSR
jgi:DNA (cytosine-5)-methyltransferase 1